MRSYTRSAAFPRTFMNDPSALAARRLAALAVSETGFVFDPRTGHSYAANATALAALAALRKGMSVEDAAACLREQFVVDGAEIEEDLTEFVCRLREFGLVPGAPGNRGRQS